MGGHLGRGRERKGETRPHTRSGLLAHHTRTPNMYTNINTPMYKFTRDSQVTPGSLIQHPNLCPGGSASGGRCAGGWPQRAGVWRRARSGPLSSQVPPRVLSLRSGTGGQRLNTPTPSAAVQIPDVASERLPQLALLLVDALFSSPPSLPRVPAAHSVSVSPVPVGRTVPRLRSPSGPSAWASEEARTSVQLSRGAGAVGRLSVGGRC